ncbi:MAG: M28 family peptidase [Phycisphaerales bacterium JB040]
MLNKWTRNAAFALAFLAGTASAFTAPGDDPGTPIADALAVVDDEVKRFNDHLVTLASPWMEGRVPGSKGMERARDYVQYYFEAFGLTPAFPAEIEGAMTDFASYRDPFGLGGTWEVNEEKILAISPRGETLLAAEDDFVFTALGGNGEVTAPASFVGYSIPNGQDGWSSFSEDDSLEGKVAVMFRFEPMDEEGNSLWSESGWSNAASFTNKIEAAIDRGAAAVVIINPPGSADNRSESLNRFRTSNGSGAPVFMVSSEAGSRLLSALDRRGRSAEEFKALANVGGGVIDLDGVLTVEGNADTEPLMAENVGAILPGVGDLADEYIVVGGHLDHVGMGYFGSRTGPGKLHPGADDNASGAAGVLLIAEKLVNTFSEMDDQTPRRSILFIAFDAEESGLNGSRHYVNDPIADIETHKIMINWDMIGRIVEDRVTVAGGNTGEGLAEWLQPYLEDESYGLTPIVPETMSGASDHTSFYMQGVPVLFSICDFADFHEDYHTPTDTSDKINRVGAVKTVRMYHDIVRDLAYKDTMFPHVSPQAQARRAESGAAANADRPRIRVRVGITPGSYEASDKGIPVAGVSEGSSAANAGIQEGDRLVRWDGQKIRSVEDWMPLLATHEGGDVVNIGVLRDGQEITLSITLEGRDDG